MSRGPAGRLVTLTFLAVVLAGGSTAGPRQEAAKTAGPQKPPTFRSLIQAVEVDIIVTDRDRRFVADLQQGEFDVREDGEPQAIQTFYLVGADTAAATTPLPAAAPAAGAPEILPAPGRVFVLVFDTEHLSRGSWRRAHAAAETFLGQHFRAPDVGGVVVNGKMLNNRLSGNAEELRAAVAAARPSTDTASRRIDLREWPRLLNEEEAIRIQQNDREALREAVTRACLEDPSLCRGYDPTPDVMGKADRVTRELRSAAGRTLAVLGAVATGLSRVQGRKSVVLLTDGFFTFQSWPELRQIVGAAARAGVTFYAIDARGLDRDTGGRDISAPGAMADYGFGTPAGFDSQSDGPNNLAVDTGGFVIRNMNNLGAALEQVALDAGRYYVLGYTPSKAEADGRFRRIEVRVKREGVLVRARRGYVATADAMTASLRPSSPATGQTALAAASPLATRQPEATERAVPIAEAPRASEPVPAAESAPPVTSAPIEVAPSSVRLRPDRSGSIAELMNASTPGDDAMGPGKARSSESVRAQAALGWDRYQQGDVEGARKALGAAAADPAAPLWVHYALGQAQFALWQYRDAASSWERVRVGAPDFQPAYFDLVDGYLQLGELGQAIAVLREAEQRWPQDVSVLNALGVVQVRRNAIDDAIASFGKAVAADPTDALAYFNLAKAHEIRYNESKRFARTSRSWVGSQDDLRAARQHYQRYLELGGPFEQSARQALQRLEWVKN